MNNTMNNIKSILMLTLAMTLFNCNEKKKTKVMPLFVGTYTDTESEGIYKLQFDAETGKILNTNLAAKITSPSYLTVSAGKDFLYAVQEINDFENDAGAVTAFSIQNDSLIELQTVSSGGAHPCHVSLSQSGHKLGVANYTGGNASIYNINIYIADLGLNALLAYNDEDTLMAKPKTILQLPEEAGPRHFTTTRNGKFLYVERNAEGMYIAMQNESTLAANFKGESFCADLHISKDEKFLYGSNREENTIVIFSINQKTGNLTLVGRESVKGDWPRNFTLDPTNKFLLVANQKSNNITVFERDLEKGTLTFLNEEKLMKPVCLMFL